MRRQADRAARVRGLMDEFGLPEDEAIFAVDLADDAHAGDIVGLSAKERGQIGLDRSLNDVATERPATEPVGVSSGSDVGRDR